MSADAIVQRVVCAWCKTTTREGAEPTSHGICEKCDAEVREQFNSDTRMGEQSNEAKQQQ